MSDPETIQLEIDTWASEIDGIDADVVRELIAVPTVIGEAFPTENIHCVAIRCADGWYAKIRAHQYDIPLAVSTAKNGELLNEDAGRGHFPEVEGPYKKQ